MKRYRIATLYGLLALALAGACLPAGAQTITTVAGQKPRALVAEINYPEGTAIDASGNLYIADTANNRIRKVAPDGTTTTVAGNGTAGYSGDNGPATSAELKDPYGVAVDTAGNLYIADTFNSCIRKVDTSGTITSVAGVCGTVGYNGDYGLAGSVELYYPFAVAAVGNQGELYIADTYNNRIRHLFLSKSTGVGGFPIYLWYVNTVAGGGSDPDYYQYGSEAATDVILNNPRGLAVDSKYLYIADTGNNVISEVVTDGTNTDGTIYPMAGTGTAGYLDSDGPHAQFDSPLGLTVDSAGTVYVADELNYAIRKITTAIVSGHAKYNVSSLVGSYYRFSGFYGDGGPAASAELNYPRSVTFDTAGNLYIADSYNQRIRRIDTSGIINTVVGNGVAGYYGDGLSSAGFGGDGGTATFAYLNSPYQTAVDAGGNIYIADRGNNRVRKIAVNGVISTIAGNGTAGSTGDGGAALNAELNDPIGVAVDGVGNVYIAEYHGNRIRKVDGNGIITTFAGNGTAGYTGDGGQATSAEIHAPIGLAVDAYNYLYIVDNGNGCIRKVTGTVISTVAGTGTYGYNGDNISAKSAQLNDPYGVALDAAGNIYIGDTNNNRIRKVATNGIITTVAGTGTGGYTGDGGAATSANIHAPLLLTVDAAGAVYFSDSANDVIRRLNLNGTISTVAGNGIKGYAGDGGAAASAEFDIPVAVSLDKLGNLYVTDYYTNRIRKVTGLASDRIFANGFE